VVVPNNRNGAPDFSDPTTVRKGRKKYQITRQDELDDLRAVLGSAAGRRVLWRIMERSKLLAHDMFTGNSATFYNLGSRDQGLWLYEEIIEADPKRFIQMLEHQLKEDQDNG
jgi:hypothetical protein